eukprot:GHVP01002047.1.p1 GENE.GHVP01002047.1~~GHVP01002047.1.p1  ORF type:complete len:352 (-),score=112.42 GHVP01002047.1:1952-3007(-)
METLREINRTFQNELKIANRRLGELQEEHEEMQRKHEMEIKTKDVRLSATEASLELWKKKYSDIAMDVETKELEQQKELLLLKETLEDLRTEKSDLELQVKNREIELNDEIQILESECQKAKQDARRVKEMSEKVKFMAPELQFWKEKAEVMERELTSLKESDPKDKNFKLENAKITEELLATRRKLEKTKNQFEDIKHRFQTEKAQKQVTNIPTESNINETSEIDEPVDKNRLMIEDIELKNRIHELETVALENSWRLKMKELGEENKELNLLKARLKRRDSEVRLLSQRDSRRSSVHAKEIKFATALAARLTLEVAEARLSQKHSNDDLAALLVRIHRRTCHAKDEEKS